MKILNAQGYHAHIVIYSKFKFNSKLYSSLFQCFFGNFVTLFWVCALLPLPLVVAVVVCFRLCRLSSLPGPRPVILCLPAVTYKSAVPLAFRIWHSSCVKDLYCFPHIVLQRSPVENSYAMLGSCWCCYCVLILLWLQFYLVSCIFCTCSYQRINVLISFHFFISFHFISINNVHWPKRFGRFF
jgi:hypothetical protein